MSKSYATAQIAQAQATRLTKKTGIPHVICNPTEGSTGWTVEQRVDPTNTVEVAEQMEQAVQQIQALALVTETERTETVSELPKGMVRIGVRLKVESPAYYDFRMGRGHKSILKSSVQDVVISEDGWLEFTCTRRYAIRKNLPV